MKRLFITTALSIITIGLFAVPARPIKKSITDTNGSTKTLALVGDEFGHYWIDENGECYTENESNNSFTLVTREIADANIRKASIRRESTNNRRRATAVNTPPQGLIILVNFSDKSFQASNSRVEMDSMLNATNYTYHKSYGSARKYFREQSNGIYNPKFDVIGPITLPEKMSYYGGNDSSGNDKNPGTMVWQACSIADRNYSVDFSKYDNNNDGYVDFVFIIYAGYGEADGAPANTIWPHAWELSSAQSYESFSMTKLDGKTVNSYACTSELNYYNSVTSPATGYSSSNPLRAGISTFCHEFSHVMGLPDYYDTNYGTNYNKNLTPGSWSIMDGGSYNEDGEIPPCYMAHDKYYCGWVTPTIMNSPENVTLPCDGETYRYVTSNGNTATATTSSTVYYLENRQQIGWDKGIPGHGMIVTKVTYNASKWENNTPNNTANSPNYQIVAADGTYTCSDDGIQGDSGDPFPGTQSITSYSPYTQYPLTDIKETNGIITFNFMNNSDSGDTGGDSGNDSDGFTYTKVTSEQSDWSGQYLIVYESGSLIFDGSRTTLDASQNTKSITIKNSTITTDPTYSFTITKNGGYYAIKSASGLYIGNSGTTNALTTSASQLQNSIYWDDDENCVYIESKTGTILRYNSMSDQERFRYFKSSSYSSQKPIQLYKKNNQSSSTAIQENRLEQNIKALTSNGALLLQNLPETSQVHIINLAGSIISHKLSTNKSETFMLEKGIYIVQVIAKDNIQTIKVAIK